jgi:hypothetical protein
MIHDQVCVEWAVELVRRRTPLKTECCLDQTLELSVSSVAAATPQPTAGTNVSGAELGGSRPVEYPHAAPLDLLEANVAIRHTSSFASTHGVHESLHHAPPANGRPST